LRPRDRVNSAYAGVVHSSRINILRRSGHGATARPGSIRPTRHQSLPMRKRLAPAAVVG